MNVGSLFSGIGGFDLGLERAGMRVVWQCEQDEFCQRVLAKHWPGVPCYSDVRSLVADAVRDGRGWEPGQGESGRSSGLDPADETLSGPMPVPVPHVDVLCGGFPCQDISLAGKGAGIEGERSGLWGEYARLVGELRPRYVIVENVAALLGRGLSRVLADLSALGYDAEWDCLPASAFGAPHRRDRLWIVAYPHEKRREWSGASRDGWLRPEDRSEANERRAADNAMRGRHGTSEGGLRAGRGGAFDAGWWSVEPDVGRVANGVPARVDRLRALGNALVPQVAEWIGRRIMSWEQA